MLVNIFIKSAVQLSNICINRARNAPDTDFAENPATFFYLKAGKTFHILIFCSLL